MVEAFCNLGYAGGCAWAPRERAWDAVRFAVCAPPSVRRTSSNAENAERSIRLRFVCERNHQPAADGELEFDMAQAKWLRRHDDSRLQKMAECFLETYLKKRT